MLYMLYLQPSCDLYHELKKYSADSVSGAGVRVQGRGGAGRNMCQKLAAVSCETDICISIIIICYP